MSYQLFSITLGFGVWLLATLTFRLFGAYFFLVDDPVVLAGLYAGVVPALWLVATAVFRHYHLSRLQSVTSATLIVLPGMTIDTFVVLFFDRILPNMPPTAAAPFGSWLLWAYAVVLTAGLLRQKV